MFSFIKRLSGTDPRLVEAEKSHSDRVDALEKANAELDALKERLDMLGAESKREGQALAKSIEMLHSVYPEGADVST